MYVKKILKVVLLLLSGFFILFRGLALDIKGAALSAVLLILLTWLYVGWTKHKSKLFLLFLLLFTLAQLINFVGWLAPELEEGKIDYFYYATNTFYILSYAVLIVKMLRQLNFKKVFKELTIPIVILVVLDIFCVTLISDTVNSLSYYEYILEYTYNAVIMILLSFALINYMYRNNKKSMLFFLGSIFIVFSEIIQLAYYYILSDDNLAYVYSSFLVVAFIFYYMQSQHVVTEPIPAYVDELMKEESRKINAQ